MEGSFACVFRLLPDGVVRSASERAKEVVPELSRQGQELAAPLLEESKEKLARALAAVKSEGRADGVLLTVPGGRVFQFSFEAASGEIMAVAVDVTELAERTRYYEQLLDSISDFVLVKGPSSRLKWANRAFREYYGMSNVQLRDLIDAPFNEPDYTKQYVLDDLWVWNNKKPLRIACEPVTRHDGVVRRFETIKTPIFDERGGVAYTVGISRDITDQLEAEEKAAHAAKMASLGEMAGGIAHEINNPLSVITARARQLRTAIERKTLTDEKLERSLHSIENSVLRMAKIVKGMRRFSREGGSDPFEIVPLREIVEDTLTLCRSRFEHAGIDVRVDDIPPDLKLSCRAVQISQILLNLLSNAFDAIQLAPSNGQRWVALKVSASADEIAIRVLDSGPGVPEDMETKIMQPFFTTKPAGQGTGLGPSVSSVIARDHGGSLKMDRATSPSCFVLRLKRQVQS